MAAHGAGEVLVNQLSRCFSLLRKQAPQPCRRMRGSEGLLSEEETHVKWRNQLEEQSKWCDAYDARHPVSIESKVMERLSLARGQRGRGTHDGRVTQQESEAVVNDWDKSPAVPADLIPRAPFTCTAPAWSRATKTDGGPAYLLRGPLSGDSQPCSSSTKRETPPSSPTSACCSSRCRWVFCRKGSCLGVLHRRFEHSAGPLRVASCGVWKTR